MSSLKSHQFISTNPSAPFQAAVFPRCPLLPPLPLQNPPRPLRTAVALEYELLIGVGRRRRRVRRWIVAGGNLAAPAGHVSAICQIYLPAGQRRASRQSRSQRGGRGETRPDRACRGVSRVSVHTGELGRDGADWHRRGVHYSRCTVARGRACRPPRAPAPAASELAWSRRWRGTS